MDESPERAELRQAELELMNQRERVAALRRELPDAPVDDYLFVEGPANLALGDEELFEVPLSQLFSAPDRTLVLMHLMFGGLQTEPCPMCCLWADGYNGIQHHLRDRVDFAVVADGEIGPLRALARERGWKHLRLLSSGGSTLKVDLGVATAEGHQLPGVSVFTLGSDGPKHRYTGTANIHADAWRGLDLYSPLWHFLDLTPEGRGDWGPKLDYE